MFNGIEGNLAICEVVDAWCRLICLIASSVED